MADIRFALTIDAKEAQAALKTISAQANELGQKLKSGVKINADAAAAKAAMDGFSQSAAAAAAELQKISEKSKINIDAKTAENDLGKTGEAAKTIAKSLEEASQSSKNFGERLAAFGLLKNGLEAAASAISGVTSSFVSLDTAAAKIRTLGGDAEKLAGEFRDIAISIAQDIPIASEDVLTATYDALSAGIKATKADIESFVTAASKLAVGGSETIGNAVNILSSVINAYGESAEKTAEYSDILFTTVNLGKTSIPELNSSLSNVVPTAAAAGVSLKNVGASLAVLTANGVPTAQSTTKLNQLLIELQKPGSTLAPILKKAGVSLESLRNESLPENLKRINQALKETGLTATQAFSSSEAGAAFNTLAKDVEGFQSTLAAFETGAGSTEAAYQNMAKSIESQSKMLEARFEAFKVRAIDSLGGLGVGAVTAAKQLEALSPALASIAAFKTIAPEGAFSKIGEAAKKAGKEAASLLGKGLESIPIEGMKSRVQSALSGLDVGSLSKKFGELGGALSSSLSRGLSSISAAAFNPLTLGIGAAAGALALFFTQTESGKKAFAEIAKIASEAFSSLAQAFAPLGKALGELFSSLASSGGGLIAALSPLLQFFGGALAKGAELFGKVLVSTFSSVASGVSTFSSLVSAAISGAQSFFAAISPVTSQVGKLASDIFSFGKSLASGFFSNAVALFQALAGAFRLISAAVGEFLSRSLAPLFAGFKTIAGVVGGFVSSLFGAAASVEKVGQATTAATGGTSKFEAAIKSIRGAIINVRAALAGVSGVLSVVGAAFRQFLEGIQTLDLSKITSAFSGLGEKTQAAFSSKWNETWAEAEKTTEKSTEKITQTVDSATKEAAAKAKENLSEPIDLKLNIRKLAEDFETAQKSLKETAETGIKGVTQNAILEESAAAQVKKITQEIGKTTDQAAREQLQKQKKQLENEIAQRRKFSEEQRKIAQKASLEEFRNRIREANEAARIDESTRRKNAKERKEAALAIQAQEMEAARLLEANDRKRRERELEDRFKLDRERLEAELKFGEQTAAAQENTRKKIIEREKQFLNERRKLQQDFLREDVASAAKLAEERAKNSIAALQARLATLSALDVRTLTQRAELQEKILREQNESEIRGYLNGIDAFRRAMEAKTEALTRSQEATKESVIAGVEKFRKEIEAVLLDATADEAEIVVKVSQTLGTDEASAALIIENVRALQDRLAREESQKRAEIDAQIETARIQSILNVSEREFLLRKQALERQLRQELNAAGENAALIAEANVRFRQGMIEAETQARASAASSVAEREREIRLGELEKTYAAEIGLFQENEKRKIALQAQLAQLTALTPSDDAVKARTEASIAALQAELATFAQNEQLKLDIERKFIRERQALLEAQMKERAGTIQAGASAEKQIFETLFSGLSTIAERFNSRRRDFESQRAELERQKETELRTTQATGQERLEILRKFREREKELEREFTGGAAALATLKTVAADIFADFGAKSREAFAQAAAGAASFAELSQTAFGNLAAAAASTFASVVASGQGVGKALAAAAFDALNSIIPIIVAQIFGQAFAQLGPIGGAAASAALTAAFYGLVAVARSAVGFRKGGFTGRGAPNEEAGVVHKGEFVHTYEKTKKYRELFEYIHRGGAPETYFQEKYLPTILLKNNVDISARTAAEFQERAGFADIRLELRRQTDILDRRMANMEAALDRTARQFSHRSEITANIRFNETNLIENMRLRTKRSALG